VSFEFNMTDGELNDLIIERIHLLDETYHAVITVDHDYVPKESET